MRNGGQALNKRVNGTGELDQRTVAGQLDQSSAVTRQQWLQPLRPMGRASVPFSSRPISRE
jgi:hypothetical protein